MKRASGPSEGGGVSVWGRDREGGGAGLNRLECVSAGQSDAEDRETDREREKREEGEKRASKERGRGGEKKEVN